MDSFRFRIRTHASESIATAATSRRAWAARPAWSVRRSGRAIGGNIPEKQRVALGSPVTRLDRRKRGLAAVVIVVEIDKERDDALTLAREVVGMAGRVRIEVIVMGVELLAHLILQHRRRLEARERQARERCNARAHKRDDEVAHSRHQHGRTVVTEQDRRARPPLW